MMFGPAARARAILAVCGVLLLAEAGEMSAAPTPAAIVIRVFTLKYRKADEVALLVRPLLTENGSVILHPKLNTLTVRDTSAAVETVAQAVASYDIPPRGVEISVTLLKASNQKPGPGIAGNVHSV